MCLPDASLHATHMTLSQALTPNLVFSCDFAGDAQPFSHFWEHTVGSGHAPLALRADWQDQMRRAHGELGFQYVRFHGILSDDMGTFLIENDQPLYSFHNADQIMDFLLSIGMKPFVELSFMPLGLSSGDKTVFHYRGNITPPRDMGAWATLIQKFISHFVERYGIDEIRQWFFEVWNEPNLDAFYTGKMEDYFELYKSTAGAIKSVDPSLKVGGPATAANAWIPEFLEFCRTNQVAVDFVSTHHYPTDAFGKPGDDTVTQLSLSKPSVLRDETAKARHDASGLPLYYTEWSTSSNPRDQLHDQPYAAAFIVQTIMEAQGLVDAYSYWTFSDIFEENYFPSVPFHGGFGLLNIHGIAKPAYRAFQILHALGDRQVALEGAHATVKGWAVRTESSLTVILINFALPLHPLTTTTVRINVKNLGLVRAALRSSIDDLHSNAPLAWLAMGSPPYPSPAAVAKLHDVSELKAEPQPFQQTGQDVSVDVTLLPYAVSAIRFDLNAPELLP